LGEAGVWPFNEMAALHYNFDDGRPLAHVRTPLYWETAIRSRLEQPERRVWGAWDGNELVGYVAAALRDDHVLIHEACGDEPALSVLFERVREEGLLAQIKQVEISLPEDCRLNAAIAATCADLRTKETKWSMGRPICGGFTEFDLDALFRAPGAHHYALDDF